MISIYYILSRQIKDISLCVRILEKGKYLAQALLLAICLFPITTYAAPPPPPSGLCISTPSGGGCAPSLQPSPPNNTPSQDITPQPPPATGSIKWYPGHYLAAWNGRLNFQNPVPTGVPTLIKGNPDFKGVVITWDWSELEPQQGKYNFTNIFDHLNEFRKWKPQPILFVSIKTRDFNRLMPDAVPVWLGKMKPSGFVVRNDTKKRIIPTLWRTNTKNVFKDMLTAMSSAKNPITGQTLDQDPLFGGITFDESALGLGPKLSKSITDLDRPPVPASQNNYVLALKDILLHARTRFPNSIIFQKLNWIQQSSSYMQSLVDFAAANGIGVSGPDFFRPGTYSLSDTAVLNGDYRGVIPLAKENQISSPMKSILSGKYNVEDVYNWLVEDPQGLKLNYIFWNKNQAQVINNTIQRNNIKYCSPAQTSANGTTLCNDLVWSFNNNSLPDNRQVVKVLKKKNFFINDALPISLQ